MLPNKYRWLSLAGVVMLTSSAYSFKNDYFEISKNLEIFTNIVKEINASYVDEIDPNKFIRSGIDGMMNSLDPYTDFIPEEDLDSYKMTTTGRYGGVGALIKTEGDYVVISEPYEGFPADKAGLRAGDKLLEIDGQSVKKKNTEEVSKLLKGKPNTEVKLLIERPGDSKPITKSVLRQEIHIKSVPYYGTLNDSKTGYIRLTQFTEDCSKDVANALRELKEKNKIQSVILDLRGNPGGLLNEAVDVANIFIPKNKEVVSTRGKRREWDKSYKTENEPVDLQIPLTVLIDEGSASASEIVSGTIQDLDRGVVIGRRSYGKGLVQTTKNVGFDAKVKLTTAKYYLPSSRCIQEIDYSKGFDAKKAYEEEPEHKPDSTHTAFKTSCGRTVYDAGGIRPDIEIEETTPANITVSLVNKQLVFDYATQYRIKHDKIPQPEQFELSDAEYNDFVQFLSGKKYDDYTTVSEDVLKRLTEVAEKENYNKALKTEIETIEAKMKADKTKDVIKFKSEIKKWLEYEIVKRYYYQTGEIRELLEDDDAAKQAINVLDNPAKYKQILSKK
jgi:carboxyl-terminal processing protease